MNEIDVAIRYIFVISLILVILAYWLGTTNVISQIGKTGVSLLQTSTGRTPEGNFASYPAQA